MINEQLAQFSTLALVTAIAIYVLGFIAFTVDAVRGTQVRSDARLESGGEGPRPTADEAGAMTALKFAMTVTVVGGIIHVAGVVMRGIATGRVPWGNMYEFSMTGSAAVTVMFLLICLRNRDLRHLGAFLYGPMLLLMMVAQTAWYLPAAHLTPSLQNSYWLVIHVFVAILSCALFTLGAVTSVLQLVRARWEEKHGGEAESRGLLARLPSAKTLEQLSFQINAIGFVLWTFTLIAGAIWAKYAWGRYWGWDPKEVWTFIIWVVYAAYLHARATQGFRGNRAAWFSLVGFVCVIFNFTVVNTVINGLHSYSGL
ncbi:c-type cytochrome biogenesis protein CcsB [Helcobacillus sp. ACRRO]|uniref:c-type cytochrome biogenesis protein CcsB n=1 Tax=Helcobacillus TaxID=1161125 RepID=UPI001EF5732A|nr:c-type cytochrome biogenesis protein CcsB [Helcobacillus massiliensis]MCG7427980.1 c-type cytochrome biogenesis protein CcsB [Helcobacillus sp. ACRRO]MDK7743015.1 c-type cytochrome biogenesis protein CcsB [Helcobacillus massiliensis]WOO92321.1 c-type cytochrome biogenesis protein CcsB [Helcobacillus massiliensis]